MNRIEFGMLRTYVQNLFTDIYYYLGNLTRSTIMVFRRFLMYKYPYHFFINVNLVSHLSISIFLLCVNARCVRISSNHDFVHLDCIIRTYVPSYWYELRKQLQTITSLNLQYCINSSIFMLYRI